MPEDIPAPKISLEERVAELIISVSGLRGVVGESLTSEVVKRYVTAFATFAPQGRIVVTYDGRASGPEIARQVQTSLIASGRDVIDAGVAATPTTGVLVRQFHAAGGVQVSASHNPSEYNGLKLFSSEGRVISAVDGAQVIALYRQESSPEATGATPGRVLPCEDSTSEHLRLVLATVDVERIRNRKFKVLLDANHGSGSVLGGKLLTALGCTVIILGGTPDGAFEHPPEPTADNLASVLPGVPEAGAAIGFCQDPDADRLAIIDENGRYLGEEFTLAICVDHVLRSESGAVVTNCSTSRMTEDLAMKHKMPFERSAVGEANVVETMLAYEAVLGGEGNGGIIDPRVGLVRDSFSGMALVLDAMAAREAPISQLADELPQYAIHKAKFVVAPSGLQNAFRALTEAFPGVESDALDGLRFDWQDKWLLVRASNTEPVVRAVAEAPTLAEAIALCDRAGKVLEGANLSPLRMTE